MVRALDSESLGLKRRLFAGSLVWAAIVLEARLGMSPYTAWLISLPLLLWCGAPFHRRFWRSLKSKKADLAMLVSISVWAAFLFSTPAVLVPDLLAPGARSHRLKAMAALIVLATLGEWIELLFRKDTGTALDRLARRVPRSARVLKDGTEINLTMPEVKVGDRVLVKPGEQIPVDGEIVEGFSQVEESIWTGAETLVEKSVGSRVLAGMINKTAPIVVSVAKDGAEMSLSRIVAAVRGGLASKRPGARRADRLAQIYVPTAVVIAVAAGVLWSWEGPQPRQSYAVTAVLLTLAAACPWSAALAKPLSLLAGMRRAQELGVLVRNPDILEWIPHPDVLLIDKKGVLTEGKPEVSEVLCFGSRREEEVLRLAMEAESRSSHLFAEALRRRGFAEGVKDAGSGQPLQAFEAFPGYGVSAILSGRRVLVGSLSWLGRHGLEPGAKERLVLQGKTDSLVGVAVDGQLAGAIAFSDPVRPDAAEGVRELEALGVQVVLASGDRGVTTYRIAETLGIGKVYAEVQAEEKVHLISELQGQGKKVAILGDGLRDAPAISQADLGLVFDRPAFPRGGIDLALESADVVLSRRDLSGVAAAIRLNEKIRVLSRENLLWAFGWNMLLLPVAAGALITRWGLGWSPLYAWSAGVLGFFSIFLNSWRLWRFFP